MALSSNEKLAIGAAVVGGVVLFAVGASASDKPTPTPTPPGECPEGFIRMPRPGFPGQYQCVREPEDPLPPPPPPDDDDDGGFDDPLPPLGNTCNYSGCGAPFDNNHETPAVYAQRIQQLGYPINFAAIAANGTLIAVSPARNIIREFQRDFNIVRSSNALNGPAALQGNLATTALNAVKNTSKLDTDGLNGNNTIAAVTRAQGLVNRMNMSWDNIVNLSGG